VALDAILESKRAEVARAKQERPVARLLDGLRPTRRDLQGAIGGARTGFILECKRRSPSEGAIREDADPVAVARAYAPFADAVSVLTDRPFFGGSLEDLGRVREAIDLPVLRKDFVLEPYQVVEARAAGADAVLLMLSVLDDQLWQACAAAAAECGMAALTEVHTDAEFDRALALDAAVIGINSRDLRTLEVDIGLIERLAPRVPSDRRIVAESGIRSHADVLALRDGCDAFLVGTSLMREPDLDGAIRAVVFGAVKVCGLRRGEDARAAREAGATWGGLVFAADSPRRVDLDSARAVRDAAPLRWAGVFVNETPEWVGTLATELSLEAVQLHGEETPETVAAVKAAVPEGCEVWKAVRLPAGSRAPRLAETGADRLVLDGFHPDARGGTGTRFDWNIAASHPDRERIILAGGLGPDNARIADAVGAGLLDVSSGVEDSPGIKSRARLDAFFAALRGTGRERR
jgi:indole-3-glycerol phosphate synthase/phosphoribosylanthranilate isomerase